jgi:hypothetical protein
LQNSEIHCALFTPENAHYDSSATSFGTLSFKSLCHQKVFLVGQLLEAGVHVLWTDNDIVWLSDPVALLLDVERRGPQTGHLVFNDVVESWSNYETKWRRSRDDNAASIDLFVQCDDDGLCAGFFLIRSHSVTIQYLSKVCALSVMRA